MCQRIGQRVDDLQLLDDRAGPTVGDDERQRRFMLRTNVNEVNVQPVDLGDEVRHGIESCFDFAPVVFGRPVIGELLHGRERHALREVRDSLRLRPAGCGDPPAQVGEFRVRDIHAKGTDCGCGFFGGAGLKGHGHSFRRGPRVAIAVHDIRLAPPDPSDEGIDRYLRLSARAPRSPVPAEPTPPRRRPLQIEAGRTYRWRRGKRPRPRRPRSSPS